MAEEGSRKFKESGDFQAKVGISKKIHIRAIHADDIAVLHEWIIDAQWSPVSLDELRSWHNVYPDHFLAAYDDNGTFYGHIFARPLAGDTTLIEMVIMRPGSRGQGIGTKLLNHVTNRYKNCVLISFPGAESFYEARGFKKTGNKMIWCDMPTTDVVISKADIVDIKVTSFHDDVIMTSQVLEYDVSAHGMDRAKLLQMYATSSKHVCLCVNMKIISGFLVLNLLKDCVKIVAFCANNPEFAEALLISAVPYCQGKRLCVAFPSTNRESATSLYKNIFGKLEKTQIEEDYLSTTGVVDDRINWAKIYGVSELDYMGFF